jgi:hypothetical protein
MLPNCQIVISANGDHKIIGLEKTENCGKLSELGKAAGKVKSDDEEDHSPVYQDVHAGKGRK